MQDELLGIVEYQKARAKLESRMNDLHEAHTLLCDTLALEEERIEQNRLYDFSNHRNRGALQSLNERISALQSQGDDLPSIHSLQSSKQSRVSRRSKHSTTSISSLEKRAETAAKAARLEAELKFHHVGSLKTTTLKKQEDEIKKLQMVKELAATHVEIEAVDKIQRERYGGLNSLCDEVLSKDNGSEDHLHKYLQSQLESTLPASTSNSAESNAITTPSSDVKAITSVSFSNCSDAPRIHTATSEMPAQASAGELNPLASPFYTGAILPHSQPKKPSPDERLDRAESD